MIVCMIIYMIVNMIVYMIAHIYIYIIGIRGIYDVYAISLATNQECCEWD